MSIYHLISDLQELGFDKAEAIEILKQSQYNNDFEHGNYRFIAMTDIDTIQVQELGNDEYILGCFNDNFLAGILDIDIEVIQALQEAEAFEELGKMIISLGKLQEVQEDYSRYDGYGHHFAHYDHREHEIGNFYAFKVN